MSITYPIKYRLVTFVGLILAVVFAAFWVIQSSEFVNNASILSLGITADFVVLLPLAYFVLIRKTKVSKFTVLPVFILSTFLASVIIPKEHQIYLKFAEYALAPLELGIIGFVIYQVSQIIKKQRKSEKSKIDFLESLREIIFKKTNNQTFANIFATEASMFYYAFGGWGKQKEINNQTYFTYHKESAYFSFAWVILFMVVVETIALHFALSLWSIIAAWILTALSVYSFFFILGDMNAIKKRPIYLDDEFLYIRIGIRWQAKIPLREVQVVELTNDVPENKSHANLILMGMPNVCLTFTKTQKATGLYGIRKNFQSLSICVDDKEKFKQIVENNIT